MKKRMQGIFEKCGAASAGWVPVGELGGCEGEKWVKGLFCAVFPYFESLRPGNISVYARGMDYHAVLKARLSSAAEALKGLYPESRFKIYVDASPYPEVRAAALCGLGVLGKNGLLITERYGSYVFIGTIASDLELQYEKNEIKNCIGCMACVRACPGGALGTDLK